MLKISYSHCKQTFKKRLGKLLREFPAHRSKISRMQFSKLPRQNPNPALLNQRLPKNIEEIAIAGMGGSSLGAKAMLSALNTRINVLDNVDPDFIIKTISALNPKKTLFIIISKSGETIETLALAKFLANKLKNPKNFIAITDNQKSTLKRLANRLKFPILESPDGIPGRFGVLSIIGLLPAALKGIHTDEILEGAKKTSWKAAYELACRQYLHFLAGKNISVIFPYAECLSNFADWYIQLLAESIGKRERVGITPLKAIGVKDQHSQLQLFLDGPPDKFFIFIKPGKSGKTHDIKIPGEKYNMQDLFDAEYKGVKKAMAFRNKPFAEISINQISAREIGELFFFFELEIAFLGSLFNINPLNQPAVELSKKITKMLLK